MPEVPGPTQQQGWKPNMDKIYGEGWSAQHLDGNGANHESFDKGPELPELTGVEMKVLRTGAKTPEAGWRIAGIEDGKYVLQKPAPELGKNAEGYDQVLEKTVDPETLIKWNTGDPEVVREREEREGRTPRNEVFAMKIELALKSLEENDDSDKLITAAELSPEERIALRERRDALQAEIADSEGLIAVKRARQSIALEERAKKDLHKDVQAGRLSNEQVRMRSASLGKAQRDAFDAHEKLPQADRNRMDEIEAESKSINEKLR